MIVFRCFVLNTESCLAAVCMNNDNEPGKNNGHTHTERNEKPTKPHDCFHYSYCLCQSNYQNQRMCQNGWYAIFTPSQYTFLLLFVSMYSFYVSQKLIIYIINIFRIDAIIRMQELKIKLKYLNIFIDNINELQFYIFFLIVFL